MEFLVVVAVTLSIPFLLFGMPEAFRFKPRAMRPDDFAGWAVRIRPWQLALAGALMVVMFLELNAHPRNQGMFFLFGVATLVVSLYLRTWRSEFLFLMDLSDDDFPGRNDKLVWSLMLTAFAPVGLWFFRSYRLAHWPEPEPKPRPDHARTAPDAL